jgi:citrate lyase subunit beta/citryl-CoA lyase
MQGWRSLLFLAANDTARMAKVHLRGADAVILDLEDAVPQHAKKEARHCAPGHIAALHALRQDVLVRINRDWRSALADLEAVLQPGLKGLVLPKVEDAGRLRSMMEMILEFTAERRLGEPAIIAMVESPASFQALDTISAVPGLTGIALGSEDFALALGVAPTPECLDLPCRMLALAAARHGLMSLGMPLPIADFHNEAAFAQAAARGRQMGLTGALCIHPRQVGAVNAAFSPSAAEMAWALRVVRAFERTGTGVATLDGHMLDRPVLLRASRLIEASAKPSDLREQARQP